MDYQERLQICQVDCDGIWDCESVYQAAETEKEEPTVDGKLFLHSESIIKV